MAKGFDLLIEFLLDEIAIRGEHGESRSNYIFLQEKLESTAVVFCTTAPAAEV
jgi:hypothetical protein